MKERFANLLIFSLIIGVEGNQFCSESEKLDQKLKEKDYATISSDYLIFKKCLDRVEKHTSEFDQQLKDFKNEIFSYDIYDYSKKVEMSLKTDTMIEKTKNLLKCFKEARGFVVYKMNILKLARSLAQFDEEFQSIDPGVMNLDLGN